MPFPRGTRRPRGLLLLLAALALSTAVRHVRAEVRAAPPVPVLAPADATPERPLPPLRQFRWKGWLAVAEFVGMILTLALGLFVYLRQRGAAEEVDDLVVIEEEPEADSAAPVGSFPCPGCGQSLKAKPGQAGKRIQCPRCGRPATVPALRAGAPDNHRW